MTPFAFRREQTMNLRRLVAIPVSVVGAAVAGLSALGAGSPAPLAAAVQARPADARVDAVFAEYGPASPGCALAVVQDGTTVYRRGYGRSTLEYDVPITPRSIFHVASISKQFTAFAVTVLAAQGKLSLDDPVRRYVPELPDFGPPVTIRHLLRHTSGLRDQWTLLRHSGWRPDDLITDQDVLAVISRQRALNFAPGAEYSYSNSGYTIAGIIVKRVTGLALREWCDVNIFKPLGMADTHFHDDHTMIVPNRTSAYEPRGGGGFRVSVPVFDTVGATSLFTTVEDLAKWDRNFYTGAVGGRSVVEEMQQAGTLNDGAAITYGLGLMVSRYRGLRIVEHGGADAGYRGHVLRFPDQRFSVIALCNVSTARPGIYARQVADIYLDAVFPQPSPFVTPAYLASESELRAVEGTYFNAITRQATRIAAEKGRLVARSGGGTLVGLAIGPGRFRQEGTLTDWTFTLEPGRPRQLRDAAGLSEEAVPWTPTPADLAAFAGDYYSAELDYTYRFLVRDGSLVLLRRRLDDRVLEPTVRDSFAAANVGDIRFERDPAGMVTGCVENTGRVRNLAFVRMAARVTAPRRP
jgi:CubicO group peptidase (beta-lactamase class C family)